MHTIIHTKTHKKSGIIKRKNSQNVTPRNIVEAFTRKRKRSINKVISEIIAVLVSDALPNPGFTEAELIGESRVEYLDEVGLRHFLDKRSPKFCGILQQWVDPKGVACMHV